MDNNEALRRVKEGGTFLCLDFPCGNDFGIDQHLWTCGENFKGIKMIPPGFHYIRWRSTNNKSSNNISGKHAERVTDITEEDQQTTYIPNFLGFFIFIKPKQVIILKWDPYIEDLIPLEEEEFKRYENGIKNMDFDKYLGPYPFSNINKWIKLTNYISLNIIDKNGPLDNKIRLLSYKENQEKQKIKLLKHWESLENKNKQEIHKDKLNINTNTFTEYINKYQFKKIPEKWIPNDNKNKNTPILGTERSKYFLDKSYLLDYLIKSKYNNNWNELYGELQFSFISFWLGESYESFEYWKELVILLCNCELSINNHSYFWIPIIDIIYFQLTIVPDDFFVDILSSNNFLIHSLRGLFEIIEFSNISNSELLNNINNLKQLSKTRFGISLQPSSDFNYDSDDENAPTIVYL